MPIVKLAEERVMSAAPDQVGRARLIAAASPHSATFLQAVPISAIGTRLDDTSLRIAIALRLGAPICARHKCICGVNVDSSGTHGLSCRYSAGRHQRHNAINGLIKAALSSANIPSRLEPKGLNRDEGKRPDGMTTMPWKEGRCLVWDFTCPDTLAPSHLNKAVTGPGVVATDAELRKKAKYAKLSAVYTLIPIAIETLGALGEEASDFLRILGRRIQESTQDNRATAFLFQRISVARQRGNAASILAADADLATESEYDIYLEVTDDNGFIEEWRHSGQDLDVHMLTKRASFLMDSAFYRSRRSLRMNNTTLPHEENEKKINHLETDEEMHHLEREETDEEMHHLKKEENNYKSKNHQKREKEKWNRRKKRDTFDECKQRLNSQPHLSGIVVEPGKDVRLTCYFCDEPNRVILGAKTWFRFVRENVGGETLFHAVLVKLDTHDDDKLNRVFMFPDHTLVILNFQPADIGAYFCDIYNEETASRGDMFSFRVNSIDETSAASIAIAWQKVSKQTSISFLSIVDILQPVGSQLVSRLSDQTQYKAPKKPLKNTKSNWIIYTEWGEWGDCNRCGDQGERRRNGRCQLRKLDPDQSSKPKYLDEVLTIYSRGAPCQSSLFTEREELKDAKNEIEIGQCNVPCRDSIGQVFGVSLKEAAKAVIRLPRLLIERPQVPTVPAGSVNYVRKPAGVAVELYCPNAFDDTTVLWYKDAAPVFAVEVAENTSRRIEVDEYYRLTFSSLVKNDSGRYSCYVDFQATVDYFVEVVIEQTEVEFWFPGILYLFGCYFTASAIFFVVMCLRHAQRIGSNRAKAYRSKKSWRKAKGWKEYAEVYGHHPKQRQRTKHNSNNNKNENQMNKNFNQRNESSEDTSEDEEETVYLRSSETRSTNSFNGISTDSDSDTIELFNDEVSNTKTQNSVDSEDSEANYDFLDSTSELDIDSDYSDTYVEDEIRVIPYWLIF